ncbi:MAG: GIY-YIG nuclease family protein [Lysobacter sp.]
MTPPIDPRDPAAVRTLSWGHCFVYVAPCAYEDHLKLGFSRDPLDRLQALHRRYFEVFDLVRAFLIEAETVRDARALELALARSITLHSAPAPLTVRREAAGHGEWYRGAYAQLAEAARTLQAQGYVLHDPMRPWLRAALLARRDLLYSWSQAMLTPQELDAPALTTPTQRVVRDALDAYVAFGIELQPALPNDVLRWHRAVTDLYY